MMNRGIITTEHDDYSYVHQAPQRPSGSIQGPGGRPDVSFQSSTQGAPPPAPTSSHAPSFALLGAPPTLTQLASLTALVSGSASSSRASNRARGGQRGRRARLAREGQIVSKLFDVFGSRPQPNNGLSLEQSVQLEMEYSSQSVFASNSISGAFVGAGFVFTLSAFTGTAALTAVFDQYRFDQIEVWINTNSPNLVNSFPMLVSAVDLDDGNPPTSVAQVQDKQGAIEASGAGGRYHRWRPHVAVAAFSGAFTSYSNMEATWIDSASPSVQHYGLKVGIIGAGFTVAYDMVVRAVITFRSPGVS